VLLFLSSSEKILYQKMFFGVKLQSSSSSSSGKWIPYVPPPEDNFSCHVSQVRRFFFQSVLFVLSLSLLFFLFAVFRDWKNTHSPPPADALNIKLSLSLSMKR